jgi:hypothetical protein
LSEPEKAQPGFAKSRHTGGKKGSRKPSQLLRDMRKVFNTAKGPNETPAQTRCREFLLDDPKGFIAQLGQLERAMAAGKTSDKAGPSSVAAPVSDPTVADEGEARALELIDRLLAEAEAEA